MGDRGAILSKAVRALMHEPFYDVRAVSPLFETAPMYTLAQPSFWNACVELDVHATAQHVLESCLRIEHHLGRVRREANGPRTVDLDVLFFGDEVIAEPDLTVPHPLYQERAFVLGPMITLAPQLRDPRTGHTMLQLWSRLSEHARAQIARVDEGWQQPITTLRRDGLFF